MLFLKLRSGINVYYKIKNTELDFESRIFHLHKIFYSATVNDELKNIA